jgi:hypothetical protein
MMGDGALAFSVSSNSKIITNPAEVGFVIILNTSPQWFDRGQQHQDQVNQMTGLWVQQLRAFSLEVFSLL